MSEEVAAPDVPTPPLALYRRYRPDTFAQVIGQGHVTEPLQRALVNNRVNHAYLFSGPRGCGKTTSARILARALNCEQGPTPTPCGVCRSCLDLARGGPGSIDVIEIDAASHGGVDDARDLRERAFFAPVSSRYKVYIVDEAHMVTTAGFNALLKLVEEPPPHVKFIFATTEPEKVIGTIRSRTHHYPFRLVPPKVLGGYLAELCEAEGIAVEPAVLPLVVRAGGGSVRDSLSVLDQLLGGAAEQGVSYLQATALLGYTPDSLLDEMVDAFAAGDAASVFAAVDKVIEVGQDPRRFAEDLLRRLRDLVIVNAVPDAVSSGLVEAADDQAERLQNQAAALGPGELARAAEVVAAGLTEMRGTTAPRLHLELMCARVLLPGADVDGRGLHARLERLERRVGMDVADHLGHTEPTRTTRTEPSQPARPQRPDVARLQRPEPVEGRTPAPDDASRPERPEPVKGRPPAPDDVSRPGRPEPVDGRPTAPDDASRPQRPEPVEGLPPAPDDVSRPGRPEPVEGRSPAPHDASRPGRPEPVEGRPPAADDVFRPERPEPVEGQPPAPGDDPGPDRSAAEPSQHPDGDGQRPGGASGSAPPPSARPGAARPGARPGSSTPADTPAQSGASAGGLTVADLRRLWPEVLEEVKRQRRFTWILLSQNAHVLGVDDGVLTLGMAGVGARDSFARGGSEDVLREALVAVLGADLRVRPVVDDGSAPAEPAAAPTRPGAGSQPSASLAAPAPASTSSPADGGSPARSDQVGPGWSTAAPPDRPTAVPATSGAPSDTAPGGPAAAGPRSAAPVEDRPPPDWAVAPGPASSDGASAVAPRPDAGGSAAAAPPAPGASSRARASIRPTRSGVTASEPVPEEEPDRDDSDVDESGGSHDELLAMHLGAELIAEEDVDR